MRMSTQVILYNKNYFLCDRFPYYIKTKERKRVSKKEKEREKECMNKYYTKLK